MRAVATSSSSGSKFKNLQKFDGSRIKGTDEKEKVSAVGRGGSAAIGNLNLDGSLKDEDLFVVGDDDEDEQSLVTDSYRENSDIRCIDTRSPTPPPAYSSSSELSATNPDKSPLSREVDSDLRANASPADLSSVPLTHADSATTIINVPGEPVHHIQKNDTLLGIAFRYGVDVRTSSSSRPLL